MCVTLRFVFRPRYDPSITVASPMGRIRYEENGTSGSRNTNQRVFTVDPQMRQRSAPPRNCVPTKLCVIVEGGAISSVLERQLAQNRCAPADLGFVGCQPQPA